MTLAWHHRFLPLFMLVVLAGCGSERALMSQVKVCLQLREGRCQESLTEVSAEAPELYATVIASGIPKTAELTFAWQYSRDRSAFQEIKQVTLQPESESQILTSTLSKLNERWPPGYYRVTVTTPAIASSENRADFIVSAQELQ